jgi:hypothetical protein
VCRRSLPFSQVNRWLLAGLWLLACEPQLLLGEVVGAAGGLSGAGGDGNETTGGAGDDAGGVPGGGQGGGDAGDAAAGAPSSCSSADGGAFGMMDNGVYNDGPLPAPWQTSFEDGFCGYRLDAGFCYSDPGAAYRLVSSPVRTGSFAAAFEIGVGGATGSHQARCVREGQLPKEAYYTAWYYLPESASEPNNWNLFHFQGGEPGSPLHGLWDVSLAELPSGALTSYVRDGLGTRVHEQQDPVPVPIGRWFQLEFYLKRAADATGEVALFQDGVEVIRVTGIRTDDTNFGQWYVGNLAAGLTPSRFTLYVDDVTVRLGP